ncbi:Squalene/phytoene synthase OS=Tsukamurella paurometabola (strain ATCC 8368 / DSM / CCUG 35730/ CIP 100753 / JCM 10117 / KCTC 9821 / NBRC 16120 / NCIMB 702349 / NCTC 13040) OX=521096 GN=Tpau_0472 PE=4 SV=1 [Tsukamurella paurometabola]|uniref:Squalene/phytoene synthase n=1 Tax=Tsukamurella paurometabola (strain ATCC 8368 / DSM 20162 / CCUG 35730 / CIP 100753 / JCM 10117 / KCTC 9821 / NBRC 16120 / NCIMB 702349 / NCTC 13040) TaxID=521096 RepID=D5US46_TSUPD|nr:squalene/phytoene synthase family protein [Tsukamurella paurometabola]ADG77113.1 Squalene/phytoene synthase [Tsukamurella paurometabola DSM 20162]SUP42827.1 squalene synthase HpnD [Tsukamurella paurometabola]
MDSTERYTAAAVAASAVVIRQYSTSFSLASRMMPRRVRSHITSIYGLVRVADEVVDGACPVDPRAHLDALEVATERAIETGFSTDLVVHAFANTARATGFGTELTRPFFASMRADLTPAPHTAESLAQYIYGSAEVVGLMCLRAYLHGAAPSDYEALASDAKRLGAAFQKINFLRDLTDDELRLGRAYLPELTPDAYAAALADAREDLEQARRGIARLPGDVRRGVRAAADLYSALLHRLEAAGLDGARAGRVRVPAASKLLAVVRGVR